MFKDVTQADPDDLEDLYENAPVGYFSLSPEGLIVKVNQAFSDLMGISKDELLGRRLRDLLTAGSAIFYETHFAPLLRMQGSFNEVALDLKAADGSKLPLLANARERRSQDGLLIVTRVAVFAAAQRRRYERELVNAQAEAETNLATERHTSELREQFIAVLGHDLRNPLAAISGAVALMLRDDPDVKATRLLRHVQSSVARMAGLIDNVLDFARGKLGGGLGIVREDGQTLSPIIDQVVQEIRSAEPNRVITIHIAADEPMSLDRARIEQLFSNLLSNAVTHGDPIAPIQVYAKVEGGSLQLSVANGGDPIPAEAMASLFEPFHRGTVRPSRQGLGLGLFIADQIARAHGGRIEVTSDVTTTRFAFVIPATKA